MCFRCLQSRQTNYRIIYFFAVWKLGWGDLKKPHWGNCGWECLFMKAGRNTPSTALLSLTWSDVLFYSFIFVCVYVNKNSRVYTIFITNFFKQFHRTRSPPPAILYIFYFYLTHTQNLNILLKTCSDSPHKSKCSSHIGTVEGSQHIVIKLLPSVWCAVGLSEKVGRGQAVMMCMHANMYVLFTHFWLLRSRSEYFYWHDTTAKYRHRLSRGTEVQR